MLYLFFYQSIFVVFYERKSTLAQVIQRSPSILEKQKFIKRRFAG